MVIIHAGRGPGGHGPLKGLLTIRIGQDAVVLVQLIQGERGHLALHGPIFLGAVEGGEVHRAGDDLLRVALGDAVQIDAVEVGAEGADGKVIAEAKLALDPLHVHEQGAILAVLQDDAGLPPVEDDLAGERCGNVATPFFQYKEYVFAWGGAYLNQYRYTWILTPYLATISNLSQAVVKNADKTMKITYTLTEQDSSS